MEDTINREKINFFGRSKFFQPHNFKSFCDNIQTYSTEKSQPKYNTHYHQNSAVRCKDVSNKKLLLLLGLCKSRFVFCLCHVGTISRILADVLLEDTVQGNNKVGSISLLQSALTAWLIKCLHWICCFSCLVERSQNHQHFFLLASSSVPLALPDENQNKATRSGLVGLVPASVGPVLASSIFSAGVQYLCKFGPWDRNTRKVWDG